MGRPDGSRTVPWMAALETPVANARSATRKMSVRIDAPPERTCCHRRRTGLLTCGAFVGPAFPLAQWPDRLLMPLTVAGQWRSYTAFPSIPRLRKYSKGGGSQEVWKPGSREVTGVESVTRWRGRIRGPGRWRG